MTSLLPTPTNSVVYSSSRRFGVHRAARVAQRDSTLRQAAGAVRRRQRAARRAIAGEQRRVGRVGEQPREQRVELGARLVLGRERA